MSEVLKSINKVHVRGIKANTRETTTLKKSGADRKDTGAGPAALLQGEKVLTRY